MLAVALAPDKIIYAREVNGYGPDEVYTLVLQAGEWVWGY
jgi:hypothetical protein